MSVHRKIQTKRVTTNTLLAMKEVGEKISMLTAYDYSLAKIVDAAGVDIILVG
ncbi:MAG: 3-methyl-2-oxobutanoate hydroxymethyltransferase, partial [Chitinophagales bacterium]